MESKNSVIRPAARDVVAAAGVFITAVNEGGLTWYRPQQGLNESAVSAVKRPVAGGFAFGGADSMPVEACSTCVVGRKNR